MKKPKFIPEFKDIPKERTKMAHLSLDERHLSFEEVELGFTEEEAVNEAKRCLSCRRCIGCGLCLAECDPQAIVYDEKPERVQLNVDAVILAPGFDEFDAKRKKELGYGKSFNVITSIEFERILSPTGPYGGVVMRPFDGEIPKRIAFIQCVGSREEGIGANFCSNVCCMYALKEAITARERVEGLDVTFFHRDIRPLTKGSEDYYLKAKNDLGFNFIKANVSNVKEDEGTGTVTIEYAENGTSQSGEFDLVVLSVGLHSPATAKRISRAVRIRPNKYGFCPVSPFTPLNTPNDGIFVAGAFGGPKDISETIAQASGAAAKAAAAISANGSRMTETENHSSKTTKNAKPKIGVFMCRYGNETQGNNDLDALKAYVQELKDVSYISESLHCCLFAGKQEIQCGVKEKGINKIIIVPCYSKSHHQLFEILAQEVGLTPEDVEIVNFDPASDIESAKTEIAKVVEKVRSGKVQSGEAIEPVQTALVLGGGLAGMTAALDIANQGFEVHLVEKSDRIGGNIQGLKYLLGEEDPIGQVKSLVERVEAHDKITIHTNAILSTFDGEVGRFTSTISRNGNDVGINHGVLILTTGARTYLPKDEYHYGEEKNVITQVELETLLSDQSSIITDLKSVVMIQCVGSRTVAHPWCSRICCEEAIKNTHKIKEVNPEAQITILHRDMRVYGFNEDYLTEAEEKGVQFIRMDGTPEVSNIKGLTVSAHDRYTKKKVELHPDLVVLSTGFVPSETNAELAKLLGLTLDKDGFFQEADPKLRPVETEREGIFICGLAHSPQSIEESLSQASAAAGKAGLFMGR